MAKKKKRKKGRKQRRLAASVADKAGRLKKARFIGAFKSTGNVTLSCLRAEIGRSTYYEWLEKDEQFQRDVESAGEEAADYLEAEARRRAIDGVDKPVIYQGQLMGREIKLADDPEPKFIPLTVKEYSDTLLIFLLKGQRPQKYRENFRLEHTGKDGAPIVVIKKLDANEAFYASKQQQQRGD